VLPYTGLAKQLRLLLSFGFPVSPLSQANLHQPVPDQVYDSYLPIDHWHMVPSTGCVDSDIVEVRFEVQRKLWKAPVYLPGQQSNVEITGGIRWYAGDSGQSVILGITPPQATFRITDV